MLSENQEKLLKQVILVATCITVVYGAFQIVDRLDPINPRPPAPPPLPDEQAVGIEDVSVERSSRPEYLHRNPHDSANTASGLFGHTVTFEMTAKGYQQRALYLDVMFYNPVTQQPITRTRRRLSVHPETQSQKALYRTWLAQDILLLEKHLVQIEAYDANGKLLERVWSDTVNLGQELLRPFTSPE